MNKKIISIFVFMLLITTIFATMSTVTASSEEKINEDDPTYELRIDIIEGDFKERCIVEGWKERPVNDGGPNPDPTKYDLVLKCEYKLQDDGYTDTTGFSNSIPGAGSAATVEMYGFGLMTISVELFENETGISVEGPIHKTGLLLLGYFIEL